MTSTDQPVNPYRITGFQLRVIALCAAVMVLDGFDTQEISFAAPAIAHAWHISPGRFGLIFGIGLFGGLIGAAVAGVTADRIGRKPVLVASVLAFGLVTLATPLVRDITALAIVRFLAGLGVGGAIPGAIAITAEYSPPRVRGAAATIAFCGIPLGSVLGSLLAAQMIPHYGWGSIFVVGGVLPLLLVPGLVAGVPESLRFLALRNDTTGLARLRARMGAAYEDLQESGGPARVPVWHLFARGRLLGTTLLSVALFLTLLMAFFLVNWIPTIATRAGIGTSAAILGVAALNIGGILGSLAISRLSMWRRPGTMIGLSYALGAFAIAGIGYTGRSGSAMLIVTFVAGFLAIGAQMCTVSLVATYYDTALRATGVGWSMGCGRAGGIIGPTLGGWLVGATQSSAVIFDAAGLVCAACALTVLLFGRLAQR
jgi:AAHS family 4-hydroxybenzoate transporter-like MFS transporter